MASLLQKVYIYALSHTHANTHIHTHHTHIRSFVHPHTHNMTSYSGIWNIKIYRIQAYVIHSILYIHSSVTYISIYAHIHSLHAYKHKYIHKIYIRMLILETINGMRTSNIFIFLNIVIHSQYVRRTVTLLPFRFIYYIHLQCMILNNSV